MNYTISLPSAQYVRDHKIPFWTVSPILNRLPQLAFNLALARPDNSRNLYSLGILLTESGPPPPSLLEQIVEDHKHCVVRRNGLKITGLIVCTKVS